MENKKSETTVGVEANHSMNRISRDLVLNPESLDSKEDIAKREKSSKWRQFLILSCLSYNNFWVAACVSLQAPFFPDEAERKGVSPTAYGFVFAVFEVAKIITAPLCGKMIAIISPKVCIIVGALIDGGACVVFGFLDQIPPGKVYIGTAFAARIFEGIGAASFVVARCSIVAAEFPNSVGKVFSLMEMVFGFGLIVGPTIGGALYEAGDFILPFVTVGGLLLLGSLLLCVIMPNIGSCQLPQQPTNIKLFLLNWDVITYNVTTVTALLFIGFNATTLEPHLRRFHLTSVVLGTIFITIGSVYALTSPIWGWVLDKGVNPLAIITFGYVLTSTGILFVGPPPFIPFKATIWSVVISLLVIGLGISAKIVASFSGSLKSTLARGFPDDITTYGMVSALFSTSFSFGSLVGSSLGGVLLDTTGYEDGTLVLLAEEYFLIVVILTHILRRALKKSSEKSEKVPCLENLALHAKKQKLSSYSSL